MAFSYISSDEKARALEAELGENAKGFKSDAADFDSAQGLVDQVVEAFGTVDIVVNNARLYTEPEYRNVAGFQLWDLTALTNLEASDQDHMEAAEARPSGNIC